MTFPTIALRALACTLLLFTAGCGSLAGDHTTIQSTEVELSQSNYTVTQLNVTGSDSAIYLLGFIPISGGRNVSDAMADLVTSVKDFRGSSKALVNVTEARSWSYWILWSSSTIELRADVVEFNP